MTQLPPPPPAFSTPLAGPPPYPVVESRQLVENPVAFHRLYRGAPNYRWWRPLVAGVLFAIFAVIALVVVSFLWVILAFATGQWTFDSVLEVGFESRMIASATDISNPLSVALLLGSLAVLLPLVPLSMLCAGLRPLRMRHSVAFRLRWRWMLSCAIPALVITVVSTALPFGLALVFGETIEPVAVDPGTFLVVAVLIILLTPLQAAAEEYIFRGLIMQIIGAWIRWVPAAIIVSTILFTIGHTQYELWGALSVAVMGVGFAIVTWRTGGLEAAIVLHVINNVIALLLLSSGIAGTTEMSSEGSGPEAPILQAIFTVAYVLWIDRLASRSGIARARELAPPPAPEPGPPAPVPAA